MSHFIIFMYIDAREMSPSQTFCHIIEYTPYLSLNRQKPLEIQDLFNGHGRRCAPMNPDNDDKKILGK